MPRNRNRTTKNNFDFPVEFLNTLPYPEKVNVSGQKANPLGEPVLSRCSKLYNSSSSSECDNATSTVSDFEILSFGKSSSSSVSWSDEFDTEATQRVQNEFDRMERVLQGKEAIPPHYNRDEYEQWIKIFPQLSITGTKMKFPMMHKSNKTSNMNEEEVLAFHSNIHYLTGDCDSEPTSSELKKIDNIKSAVIEQVFQSISSKLLHTKKLSKPNAVSKSNNLKISKKSDQLNQSNTLSLATQFDSFLRISPVLLQDAGNRAHRTVDTRQKSSNSISRSEKLASRWMREEPIEYLSLPYVPTTSAKNRPHKTVRKSGKSRYSSKVPRSNCVSLPPIKTLSIPLTNQYRSISATPRQPIKGLSATSVQANSLLASKNSRFDAANYLVQNDLEPTKKVLRHLK